MFTPGPWILKNTYHVFTNPQAREDGRQRHICSTADDENPNTMNEENAANANLVAASPEMFALLQTIAAECRATFVDTDEMAPEWVRILADVDAVISKVATEHTCGTCGAPCDKDSVTCDGCDGGAE